MSTNSVPILFLVFNRPDNTQRVFDAIRNQKPKYLFIAADGPRHDKAGESELCDQTRTIATSIDWDCELKTLFRDKNLGCKLAVSAGINWFFEQVDEGIILEDDCLPDASFFPFCEQLLEKYRSDSSVMSISGSNLLGRPWKDESQSYFWGQGGIWGWATWKRAWAMFDLEMKDWRKKEIKAKVKGALGTKEWYEYYLGMFESSFNGTLDTWDIQWLYSILIHNGFSVNPSINLVKNIGFGEGTHTNSQNSPIARLDLTSIEFPLKHPEQKVLDIDYLKIMYNEIIGQHSSQQLHIPKSLKSFLKKLLSLTKFPMSRLKR